MLVLQRKKNEAIIINDTIRITISDISSDKVRLSIDAPKEIPIVRAELLEVIQENKEAEQSVSLAALSSLKDLLKEKE